VIQRDAVGIAFDPAGDAEQLVGFMSSGWPQRVSVGSGRRAGVSLTGPKRRLFAGGGAGNEKAVGEFYLNPIDVKLNSPGASEQIETPLSSKGRAQRFSSVSNVGCFFVPFLGSEDRDSFL